MVSITDPAVTRPWTLLFSAISRSTDGEHVWRQANMKHSLTMSLFESVKKTSFYGSQANMNQTPGGQSDTLVDNFAIWMDEKDFLLLLAAV